MSDEKALTLMPREAPRELPRVLEERAYRIPDRVMVAGVCAVLMFAVLAFGAVEPWAIFVVESAAAALLLTCLVQRASGARERLYGSPLYAPLLLIGALGAAQMALGGTSYRFATRSELLLDAAYLALLFVTVQHIRGEEERRLFARVMTVFGFLLAVFAVIQDFTSEGKLYWVHPPRFGGIIYGPYVDHSHYAGLMEMLTPIPVVMCLGRRITGGKKALLGFMAAFMAASLVMSRSMGGLIAFVGAWMILGPFMFQSERGRRMATGLAVAAVLTAGFVLWIDGGPVLERLAALQEPIRSDSFAPGQTTSRLVIAKDTLRLAVAHPLAGWGLGAYQAIYPQYQSFYSRTYIDHAHNDYLELLAEGGLVGAGALAWFLVALYRRGLRRLDFWSRNPARAIRLGALVGCTSLLLHSLADFNLHIPANAAVFFVLCGLASTPHDSARSMSGVRAGMQPAADLGGDPPAPEVETAADREQVSGEVVEGDATAE